MTAPHPREHSGTEKDRRLSAFLDKVETLFKKRHAEPLTYEASVNGGPPSLAKDKARAHALGRGEEFELAALTHILELEDAEVKEVAKVSPLAAEAYERELDAQRGLALHRFGEEHDNAIRRAMRRWCRHDEETGPDRQERAYARLGCSTLIYPFDAGPPRMPDEANGGFREHARRESALGEARRRTDGQRSGAESRDQLGMG